MAEVTDGARQHPPPRRLLAATDLSSRSDRALRRAALLARQLGADLLLLHAVDDDQPASLIEAARREALALLRAQAAGLPELQPGQLTPRIEAGDPFEVLLHVAEAEAAALIILGEHRRQPLRDIFAGTTVERVMRHGSRPVLMVNQPPAGPYRQVLAATDLSPHSARAIRAALQLGLLDGADLTLLHAYEPAGLGALALADAPPASIAAHEAAEGRAAATALAGFAATLDLPRPPERRVVPGRAATVIKDMAARLQPDLLLLGTAGAGFLRRAVIGSVAAEVLGAVRCDTLAVPPGDAG